MDALTTAFFAFGIYEAMREQGFDADKYGGGQMHFVRDLIDEANLANLMSYKDRSEENGQVFVYEVAEPFGHWLAMQRLKEEFQPLHLGAKLLELSQ